MKPETAKNSLRAGDVVGVTVSVDEEDDGLERFRVVDLTQDGFVGWGPLGASKRTVRGLFFDQVAEYTSREEARSDYALAHDDVEVDVRTPVDFKQGEPGTAGLSQDGGDE